MNDHQAIPDEAVEAAKEAMREVTPPAGVSKADWLAEHGEWALLAGAIAAALEAAAPHMAAQALREAAEAAMDHANGMDGSLIRERENRGYMQRHNVTSAARWMRARAEQMEARK